jgi:ribosome-associated protein
MATHAPRVANRNALKVTTTLALCNIHRRYGHRHLGSRGTSPRQRKGAHSRVGAHRAGHAGRRAGGQHVNTSSTRVEVAWDLRHSTALTDDQRARLEARLASRLDTRGVIRVVAADTRSQTQNRVLALTRLARLVRDGLVVPKVRRATKPSRAAKQTRLDEKKRRSSVKRDRHFRGED